MKITFVLLTLIILAMPQSSFAAIGCTLSNPAEDLKYLYPEMTTYKEDLNEFPRLKVSTKSPAVSPSASMCPARAV